VPTFRCIQLLSGVSTCFYLFCPCLHVAHQNTRANGENFVVNRHKTLVNTFKTYYFIQACLHSLIFVRACCWGSIWVVLSKQEERDWCLANGTIAIVLGLSSCLLIGGYEFAQLVWLYLDWMVSPLFLEKNCRGSEHLSHIILPGVFSVIDLLKGDSPGLHLYISKCNFNSFVIFQI